MKVKTLTHKFYILTPEKGEELSEQSEATNNWIDLVRSRVEHCFGSTDLK